MSTISALSHQVVVPSTAELNDTSEQDEIDSKRLDFIEILITQLKNQNPLDPMDTDEYTNQLIQYSQLDQQLEMKVGINSMKEILRGQNSILALDYMGQDVELTTNAAVVQDGKAVWNYIIQGEKADVKVQVLNEDKDVIHEIEGKTIDGVHQVIFDAAASGFDEDTPLFLQIFAKDKNGEFNKKIGITSHVRVDGLTGDGQDPYMTAGSITFGVKDILKVSEEFTPSSTTVISTSKDKTVESNNGDSNDASGSDAGTADSDNTTGS